LTKKHVLLHELCLSFLVKFLLLHFLAFSQLTGVWGGGGGLQSRFSLFYLLSLYYSVYGRHFCEKMKEIGAQEVFLINFWKLYVLASRMLHTALPGLRRPPHYTNTSLHQSLAKTGALGNQASSSKCVKYVSVA